MSKSNKKILPLELEKILLKKFPKIFNVIESSITNYQIPDVMPSGIISNIIVNNYNCDLLNAQKYTPMVHAIYTWRKNKKIYEFDNDIADLLISAFDNDQQEIPVATFLHCMPFNGVYLKINKSDFSAFITLDYSFDDNMQTVKAVKLYFPNIGYSSSFPIQNASIKESIQAELNSILNALNDPKYIDTVRIYYHGMTDDSIKQTIRMQCLKDWSEHKEYIYSAIALITYLCAENAEIEKTENSNKTEPLNNIKKIEKTNTFTASTNRKNAKQETIKVGYRIGKAIRYYEDTQSTSGKEINISGTTNNHSKKAAHVRRGHYHHFWIGSKKNGTQELILKWVAPTFINATIEDEIIPTKHRIK